MFKMVDITGVDRIVMCLCRFMDPETIFLLSTHLLLMSHPLQSFHSSCNNVSEAFSSSSSSSSSSPCSSTVSSPDSPTPSGSSSAYQTELCPTAEPCGSARLKPSLASHHKRSVSMTSLPVYNRQVADSCIVRVSVDMHQSNGNMYKSILVS